MSAADITLDESDTVQRETKPINPLNRRMPTGMNFGDKIDTKIQFRPSLDIDDYFVSCLNQFQRKAISNSKTGTVRARRPNKTFKAPLLPPNSWKYLAENGSADTLHRWLGNLHHVS